MNPGISVVVPAFNESKTFPETLPHLNAALRSFREKFKLPAELIVVDNASTDSTAEVAEQLGARVICHEIRNISSVRNAGIRAANYELVVTVDADSFVPVDALERIWMAMLSRRYIGGASGFEIPFCHPFSTQTGFVISSPMKSELSLQEKYAPKSICFGCGPANTKGLRIQSRVRGDEVVATWMPEKHHEAFPGMLNGGIIGSLLDCHCNWTAAWHLMNRNGLDHPPCTVTAEYSIKLLRPTPTDAPVELSARIVDSKEDRATVEATLTAHGKVCATCRGVFVAVKPGHPAYHRW